MYQRNTTNNDNRRQFVIQNHYFTDQRKGNNELAIQALSIIAADLQSQINNLPSGSGSGGGGDDPNIGTMWLYFYLSYIHIYIYTNMLERIFVYIT